MPCFDQLSPEHPSFYSKLQQPLCQHFLTTHSSTIIHFYITFTAINLLLIHFQSPEYTVFQPHSSPVHISATTCFIRQLTHFNHRNQTSSNHFCHHLTAIVPPPQHQQHTTHIFIINNYTSLPYFTAATTKFIQQSPFLNKQPNPQYLTSN